MSAITRARELLRVSQDRSGRERSITEQQDDHRRRWPEWEWGEQYRDVGSASRYARKDRDDFRRLIRDLHGNRFGADVLVMWEGSRGSRKVGEWVELIELCEQRNVKVAVYTDGRVYDPANPRDRRSLLEDAVDSEYESAKVSARATRAAAANAAAGVPHGPVPFGYRRRYDEATRRFVAQEPEPAEAEIIRELFDRLASGHALGAIARDFAERGIASRSGKKFSAQHLRHLARNPAYAGQRLHVTGRRNGNVHPGEGELTEGQWPAIVDRQRWLVVQRVLNDPKRRTTRPGRGLYLLSMIARCDVCSEVVISSQDNRTDRAPFYRCRKGHVQIDRAALDELAERLIVGYLSKPENTYVDAAGDEQLAAARDEVSAIQAELDDLADQVGRGELSASLAARAEPAITERLRAAAARADELATPSALRALLGPDADVPARWEGMPMSARREVARLVLSPDLLGELRVSRAPYRGADVTERVTLRRVDSSH